MSVALSTAQVAQRPTITINPKPLPKFKQLYKLPPGTWLVINIGGRGGGKSYETAKLAVIESVAYGKRIAVLRDEKTTIANSILNDIKSQYKRLNEKSAGYFDRYYQMNEDGLKKKKDNQDLIFTMGFRASSNSKTTNMKSISEVDIALIEEFEDIRDEFRFNQFADGIRKKGSYILINSNVPDKSHWFVRRFFNLVATGYDGYFELQPKNIEGVVYIQSTFEDNPHLQQHTITNYRNYGKEGSNNYDRHYYLTQILGYCSSGRTGMVFSGWNRISWEEYHKLDYQRYYYCDFGETDPTAIGEVKIYKNMALVKPLFNKPANVLDIGIFLCQQGFTEDDMIICDSAQVDKRGVYRIVQLQSGWDESNCDDMVLTKYPQLREGFMAVGVKKVAGKDGWIQDNISRLKNYDVYVIESPLGDVLYNDEYLNYVYQVDKNGNSTGKPVDGNDHHINGLEYVIASYRSW